MEPGDKVIWQYTPRGGYGYVHPDNGVTARVVTKRVRLGVGKHDGQIVERSVDPSNLVAAKPRGPDRAG